jgi:hypothetical protein
MLIYYQIGLTLNKGSSKKGAVVFSQKIPPLPVFFLGVGVSLAGRLAKKPVNYFIFNA